MSRNRSLLLRATPALALSLTVALTGCSEQGSPGTPPDGEQSEAVPEGSTMGYLEALYERDPQIEQFVSPSDLIKRGNTICNNARDHWEAQGTGGRFSLFQVATQDVDTPTLYIAPEALDYLCPELNPDNVPEGETPQGVQLDPGAAKPDSELPDGDLVDFNAIITLPGAGGGGNTQGGFARECQGTGEYASLRSGAAVELRTQGEPSTSTTGEIGSGIVKGRDCQFFVTVLDVPLDDGALYELAVGLEYPFTISSDQVAAARFSPLDLPIRIP